MKLTKLLVVSAIALVSLSVTAEVSKVTSAQIKAGASLEQAAKSAKSAGLSIVDTVELLLNNGFDSVAIATALIPVYGDAEYVLKAVHALNPSVGLAQVALDNGLDPSAFVPSTAAGKIQSSFGIAPASSIQGGGINAASRS